MKSKQQKELELAQNRLDWDQDYINQDDSRTWSLMGEDPSLVEELFFDPETGIFHFYGTKFLNDNPVGYQRWFNEQEQEIFDPSTGFQVQIEEPNELLNLLLEQEELEIDEDADIEVLEWKLSPFSIGIQWLQKLKNGLFFALRVDECNLVHFEMIEYPVKKTKETED